MDQEQFVQRTRGNRESRELIGRCILWGSFACAAAVLCAILWNVFAQGIGHLSFSFLTNFASRFPEKAGIYPALVGTLWIAGLTALFAFPVGIGAAIYLEEYEQDSWYVRIIKLNIANLAGVPSILYGMLGLMVFAEALVMGRTIIAGSLTMALLVLPIVITSSQEALKSVPRSYRDGALALGASKGQTVVRVVLPAALPGIITGTIFAIARVIGETAPMIAIAALVYLTFAPNSPLSRFTVLPIQIYDWLSRPQQGFQDLAATGILVLLGVLALVNGTGIILRALLQRKSEE